MIDALEARSNRRYRAQEALDNVIYPRIREASFNSDYVDIQLDLEENEIAYVQSVLDGLDNPFYTYRKLLKAKSLTWNTEVWMLRVRWAGPTAVDSNGF